MIKIGSRVRLTKEALEQTGAHCTAALLRQAAGKYFNPKHIYTITHFRDKDVPCFDAPGYNDFGIDINDVELAKQLILIRRKHE